MNIREAIEVTIYGNSKILIPIKSIVTFAQQSNDINEFKTCLYVKGLGLLRARLIADQLQYGRTDITTNDVPDIEMVEIMEEYSSIKFLLSMKPKDIDDKI